MGPKTNPRARAAERKQAQDAEKQQQEAARLERAQQESWSEGAKKDSARRLHDEQKRLEGSV